MRHVMLIDGLVHRRADNRRRRYAVGTAGYFFTCCLGDGDGRVVGDDVPVSCLRCLAIRDIDAGDQR